MFLEDNVQKNFFKFWKESVSGSPLLNNVDDDNDNNECYFKHVP